MKLFFCGLIILSAAISPITSTAQDTIKKEKADTTIQMVEEIASFPGGEDSLRKHLAANTVYPREAIKKNIEGTVYIQFIVERDGSVTNVTVKQSNYPVLNQAAIDAVNTLPKWRPGKQRGKPVRTMMVLPVSFRLN